MMHAGKSRESVCFFLTVLGVTGERGEKQGEEEWEERKEENKGEGKNK